MSGSLLIRFLIACCCLPAALRAQSPTPTHANVPYGRHERQVLDFWQASPSAPAPLVLFIHGGGWMFGDKNPVPGLEEYLAAGISVAAINYRYTSHAAAAGIAPPVKAPLEDAARALQVLRSRTAEWKIDQRRIAATGRSAGACTSLWLAFHDDLANPNSPDLVARESTRLWCAAVVRAQTTLDPQQMRQWTPNSDYGGQAFGFTTDPTNRAALRSRFAEFFAARDIIWPSIQEYSPYSHVTADDPPVYLIYDSVPTPGKDANDPTHTANFGVLLKERLDFVGVECELVYPGAPDVRHAREQEFLIEKLRRARDR